MSEPENTPTKDRLGLWFTLALAVVIAAWVLWIVFQPTFPKEISGLGEDGFAGLNALFSGLAFAGLIVALFLQRHELRLQRKELSLQREELKNNVAELKRHADSSEKQEKLLKQQHKLLKTQQEIEVTISLSHIDFGIGSASTKITMLYVDVVNIKPTPFYITHTLIDFDDEILTLRTKEEGPVAHGESRRYDGYLKGAPTLRSIACVGQNGTVWEIDSRQVRALGEFIQKAHDAFEDHRGVWIPIVGDDTISFGRPTRASKGVMMHYRRVKSDRDSN